ncbi:MAG: PfkB family carbohydrate kinase [Acidobacteriota bacterium]|nr:PfkB family carbohydrate kinase [Acidobacteriota bacterium]
MIDVAGIGASSIDLVYVLPAYPAADGRLSKLPIRSHFVSPGGQTATTMAACAALGLRAVFLGATGSDANGARVREELTRRGVDVTRSPVADGPQPYAVILIVEGTGERIVLCHRGEIPALRPALVPSRLLHVDDTDEDAAIAAASIARAEGRLVTTDIDRVTSRTKELLAMATHPVLAEHVPALLTGEPDLARALRSLRALTPAPLIVTRGAAGATALEGDTVIDVRGFEVEAVDTTGAGDIFRAGLIAALFDEQPLRAALRYANAAAAASCTKRGAMTSVPTRADIANLLR